MELEDVGIEITFRLFLFRFDIEFSPFDWQFGIEKYERVKLLCVGCFNFCFTWLGG